MTDAEAGAIGSDQNCGDKMCTKSADGGYLRAGCMQDRMDQDHARRERYVASRRTRARALTAVVECQAVADIHRRSLVPHLMGVCPRRLFRGTTQPSMHRVPTCCRGTERKDYILLDGCSLQRFVLSPVSPVHTAVDLHIRVKCILLTDNQC